MRRRRIWYALGVLVSAVGGAFPSFSLPADLYVLTVGGILFWLGLTAGPPRRNAPSLDRSALWWLLPTLAMAAIEFVTFAHGSTHDYPTLSVLSDPILESYLGRSVLHFAWLYVFWRLVHR